MGGLVRIPLHLTFLLLISLLSVKGSKHAPYLNPGFHFDYAKPNQPLIIPVTSQCEKIHLKWTRDAANDTGLSPVAPYFLQVYNSASSTPYFVEAGFGPSFDWDVPFAPNTRYQICMFDINGVSGGCQQAYSMIANSTVDKPSCKNVTAPPALSVSQVPTGAMSLYSHIDQCKSLSVTPLSGTPPFTLTIAPSNHPPYNTTSKTMDTISWQVSLPLGFNFYVSLESSDGSMWASGPLTVGGLGQDNCLAPGSLSKGDFEKILIGSTVGSLIFGIAVGITGYLVFLRLRRRNTTPSQADFEEKFTCNNPLRSLRAASSFASPSIAPSSSLAPESLILSSIPITPTIPSTRSSVLPEAPPPLTLPPPRRPPRGHRSVEPYIIPPSEIGTDSTLNRYPADVKRPLLSRDISLVSRDDTSSLASSSNSQSNSLSRALSTQSRAPTYVSTRLRNVINANETDTPDLPPEYGRHATDTSLSYAPSVLSSGSRF